MLEPYGAGPEVAPIEFYTEMKAPKRERDMSTGQLHRWLRHWRALEHYRHAHAFDFLASQFVLVRSGTW